MIAVKSEASGPAFVLASVLSAYPDAYFEQNLRLLLNNEDLEIGLSSEAKKLLSEIKQYLEQVFGTLGATEDLRSVYIDLFDRGRQVNSLYETEYGRGRSLVKGNQLVDIAGFYKAFGFEVGGQNTHTEMLDHIGVELEFYAILIMKTLLLSQSGDEQGHEIVVDAQKKFLKDHLGRWVEALSQRPGVLEHGFYLKVFRFCNEIVQAECHRLGVEIIKESWLGDSSISGEISCGGSV